MTDLTTTYMGIPLRNPLIAASSSLTGTVEGVKKVADAGVGAVVLKSLFEEQISHDTGILEQYADYVGHGEAAEYIHNYGMELGPRQYLQLVENAKKAVEIPVLASVNCFSTERWADYAKKLELAGADGIELNIAVLPNSIKTSGEEIENLYLQILHEVKSRINIPVAVKLGPYFSSLANLADKMTRDLVEAPDFSVGWCGTSNSHGKITWRGADALVLFNRFYQLDMDIENLQLVAGNPYSSSSELHLALRWISLLHGRIHADLSATTGIHSGRDAIKQILAGAQTVQLCSVLYKNGVQHVEEILTDIQNWMNNKGFKSLADFRGRLSQKHSQTPESFERLQYIKLFVGIE